MPIRATIYIEATPEPAIVAEAYFLSAARAQDMWGVLDESAAIADGEVALNFAAQGRPTHWAPLSQATIERRTRALTQGQKDLISKLRTGSPTNPTPDLQGAFPILIDSGDLLAGATSGDNWQRRTLGFASQAVEMLDPTGYGHFHVTGTRYMPQRDWTYISQDAIDKMANIMADWVVSGA